MPIEPAEIIETEDATAVCDGGEGPLGHPRVFLNLGRDGAVDCPYCGRRYVRKGAAPTRQDPGR